VSPINRKMFAMLLQANSLQRSSGTAGAGVNAIGASVHRAAATQVIPNNTSTLISWDTTDFDTSGFVAGALPLTLLTIPFSGLYLASAGVLWQGGQVSELSMNFQKNGTNNFGQTGIPNNTLSSSIGCDLSYLFNATAGDTIGVNVFQASGGNVNVIGAGSITFFSLLGFH
jgi:hypothetical protein